MSFAGKKKGGFSAGGSAPAPATAKVQAGPAAGKGKQRAVDIFNNADDDDEEEQDEDEEFDDGDDDDLDDEEDLDEYGVDDEDDDDEADTDEEIEAAKAAVAKSSQTAKRKRRATSPGAFGSTLQSLLGGGPEADAADGQESGDEPDDDDSVSAAGPPKKKNKGRQAPAPGSITTATTGTGLGSSRPSAILSLAPHLRRTLTHQKLNAKASRLATQQRKMREERAHVTDVIGGWGPPGVLPTVDQAAWDQLGAAKRKKKEKEMLGGNVVGSKKLAVGGIVPVDETDKDQRAWLEEGGSRAYERKLRKVAQRGVVKLFNAIRAAQTASLDDVDVEAAAPAADAPTGTIKKPAMPGGKEAALSNLSKSNFLDLIRSGTGTGKAK
ncbi:unnamed protein product [Tilletia controversa]|uniref:Rrp15p-domain-containing protein n=3 Tax=Tilletia TaxID=13289 RepID=A0A8X7SYT9_9BASI|nr:hypothetical protein CF335_g4017 [Tilletia laevis]KAE8203750.1 hypothetical protein CF328_g1471 [Tilletia controversa]KAE8265047.1 hypothetical protein A4X03_0g518 [Tilletia caries]KAE8200189.1 hypothetical protein CF336_g821 [Tilletia laevis]KAE8251846.1 hypothetical protein A4X06_0g2508 [Tilletia controversa]